MHPEATQSLGRFMKKRPGFFQPGLVRQIVSSDLATARIDVAPAWVHITAAMINGIAATGVDRGATGVVFFIRTICFCGFFVVTHVITSHNFRKNIF